MGAPEIGSSTAEEMEEKSSRRMYISGQSHLLWDG